MTPILIAIVVILIYLWSKLKLDAKYYPLMVMPGPKDYPIIGSLLEISRDKEKILTDFEDKAKKYGTYRDRMFNIFQVNICTAEDAEVVLTNTENLKKSIIYRFMQPWIGTGLLTSTDAKWHTRRKMLTPSFHFAMLRQFVDVMVENSDRLVNLLAPECEKYQTDIKPLISDCALFTICETSMGTKLQPTDSKCRSYMDSVKKVGWLIMYRLISPWFHSDFIFNLFHGKEQTTYLKTLHKFTNDVITEREKNIKDSDIEDLKKIDDDDFVSKKRLAMLDLLIKEKRSNKIEQEGMREEVDTFMFEGHDTVSMALNFAFMMIANRPDIQKKIMEEQYSLFGNKKPRFAYQDLQRMSYLEIFIKESLRLYPSVPIIGRETTKNMKLREYTLPPGVLLTIHIRSIHRDPKHYTDPEKFDPERFSPENSKGRHPFAFVPFSAGPRNCIGQKYAMLEMKCIISSVLWNYELEAVDTPENVIFTMDLVMRSKGPLYVKFKNREHPSEFPA